MVAQANRRPGPLLRHVHRRQKALLATGIIKAEGDVTSGDVHLAVKLPLLLKKASTVCALR
ncbi:hypothetical protein ACNKHQ_04575 [Shigella flexneri]